jgi:hypothetical protein
MTDSQKEDSAKPSPLDRRAVLRAAAWGGGIVGLGGLAGYAASRIARKPPVGAGRKAALGKEFTYDVSRFQKVDPKLLRCDEVRRFPVGLERPRNIALDKDGGIYVCGDGGIRKFTSDGETVSSIALDGTIRSLAVRANGEILAGMDGRIVALDPDGGELAVWSEFDAKMLPTAITISGDDIFVADAGNRVVLRLDGAGKTLAVIGKRDPDRNVPGFVVPSPYFCARMAPDGLLRVTNPGAHRVEAYTTDGAFELAWGKGSFAIEGFCGCCNPVSFDIFPDGSFVTCEKGLPRVKLYDAHGEFAGVVAGPEDFPEYLAAANAGAPDSLGSGIYAAIDPQGRIVVLDVVGRTVRIMQRKEEDDD